MPRRTHFEPPVWLMERHWPAGGREARAREAWELRLAGLKIREIGERMGLSTSMAGELIADPSAERIGERKAKRSHPCADCGIPVSNAGSEPPERCQACRHEFERNDPAYRLLQGRGRGRLKWSDEQLLDAIRSIARNGVASLGDYDVAYARAQRGSMPSKALIRRRFDTWGAAVAAAGLRTRYATRGPQAHRRGTSDVLDIIHACAIEVGRFPTYADYAAWARDRPDAPSESWIRMRVGSWNELAAMYQQSVTPVAA